MLVGYILDVSIGDLGGHRAVGEGVVNEVANIVIPVADVRRMILENLFLVAGIHQIVEALLPHLGVQVAQDKDIGVDGCLVKSLQKCDAVGFTLIDIISGVTRAGLEVVHTQRECLTGSLTLEGLHAHHSRIDISIAYCRRDIIS